MKVLITGGAGFIGHNLAISLKKKGYKCQLIDSLGVNNFKSKKHNKNKNIKLFKKILIERFKLLKKNKLKIEIIDLRNKGATIIFSTHRMESVEELCEDIALINSIFLIGKDLI